MSLLPVSAIELPLTGLLYSVFAAFKSLNHHTMRNSLDLRAQTDCHIYGLQ